MVELDFLNCNKVARMEFSKTELSRMREVKESRYDIKKKEDLMIRKMLSFRLRITRLNGEIEVKKPDFI